MKLAKKYTCFLLSFALFFSLFSISASTVSASVPADKATSDENVIALQTANIKSYKTDTGYEVTCDLIQRTPSDTDMNSSRGIGWIIVGNAKFRLSLMPGNGMGYADWSFSLTNNDFIKSVKGTLTVEKDIFGPINPNLAQCTVKESYLGTLYKTATGSEAFDFPGDISYDQNIIFKWSGFYIDGVTDSYSVTNGNQQGKVSDFI